MRSLHEIIGHTATEEFSHHTIHSAVEVLFYPKEQNNKYKKVNIEIGLMLS